MNRRKMKALPPVPADRVSQSKKCMVNGQEMTLVALPLIFQNFFQLGKAPGNEVAHEMMAMVKIYNGIDPAVEDRCRSEWYLKRMSSYCRQQEAKA